MAKLKAPTLNIEFIEKSISAIQRGDRGIVVLGIREKNPIEFTKVITVADIPSDLSEFNKDQIKMALLGYQKAPLKVMVYCMDGGDDAVLEDEYNKMFNFLENYKWNYLAIPTVETDGKAADVASWIKSCRTIKHKVFKAVLPNQAADTEGVINVTSSLILPGDVTYTPEQCCARVAGIIAGTPFSISCTYAPITEALDCSVVDDVDEAVGNGELVFINDGSKVKIVRGVNSFVTTMDTKGDQFKKIKIVDAMDMIADDIRTTAEDSYLGKYANTYDNKCLLITAINGYLDGLVTLGILSGGYVELDIEAMRLYFKQKGGIVKLEDGSEKPLDDCLDSEIKSANTGSIVHLIGHISILDAIEDIDLPIYI